MTDEIDGEDLEKEIAWSITAVLSAARCAAGRYRSIGKDDRYAEKRKDAESYLADPAIPEADIPYLTGYADVNGLTLQQGAEIIITKVREARAAGARIETAEDAGKLAVKNAQTVRDVINAREAAVAALEDI